MATTAFSGRNGQIRALHGIRGEPRELADGRSELVPITDSDFVMKADLVLLAMGFTGPRDMPLLAHLGVNRDARGAIATDSAHRTSVPGVFAAGDVRRGASLIVWAIREGRDAATAMHKYLATLPPA